MTLSSPKEKDKDGLLVAISRIKPGIITPATYDNWYSEVHAPDVVNMSAIHIAARYHAFETPLDSANWPFLALYHVPDVDFLGSEEFRNVPLTSDLLPRPTGNCYEVADFDIRYYRTVARGGSEADMPAEPASSILLVELDGSQDGMTLEKAMSTWLDSSTFLDRCVPRRVVIYEAFWALLYQDEKFKELPRFLATFEFGGDGDIYDEAIKQIQSVTDIRRWDFRRAFSKSE